MIFSIYIKLAHEQQKKVRKTETLPNVKTEKWKYIFI